MHLSEVMYVVFKCAGVFTSCALLVDGTHRALMEIEDGDAAKLMIEDAGPFQDEKINFPIT